MSTLKEAISTTADGRVILADDTLAMIEATFAPAGAGTTNSGNCNGTSNVDCTNETRCRDSSNTSLCSNMAACLVDSQLPQ
jgi:hypothetical protein